MNWCICAARQECARSRRANEWMETLRQILKRCCARRREILSLTEAHAAHYRIGLVFCEFCAVVQNESENAHNKIDWLQFRAAGLRSRPFRRPIIQFAISFTRMQLWDESRVHWFCSVFSHFLVNTFANYVNWNFLAFLGCRKIRGWLIVWGDVVCTVKVLLQIYDFWSEQ